MRKPSHYGALALITVGIAGASLAFAQPEGRTPRPDARPAEQRPQMSREMLEQRLAERREEVARMESMLRRMDEGGAHRNQEQHEPRGQSPEQPEPGPVGGPPRQPPRERVLAFLREHHPEFARHLDELHKDRPDLADRALVDLAPRLRELGELRETDPPLFAMRLEGNMLDWQMRRTVFETVRSAREQGEQHKVDAPALRATLAPLVEQRFRLSLRERAHSIGSLEQRIATLRDEIATDEAKAPRIIEERLDRLMEHVERMTQGAPRFEGRRPGQGRPGQHNSGQRPAERREPRQAEPGTPKPNDP